MIIEINKPWDGENIKEWKKYFWLVTKYFDLLIYKIEGKKFLLVRINKWNWKFGKSKRWFWKI